MRRMVLYLNFESFELSLSVQFPLRYEIVSIIWYS